ncbi:hypothetical protein FGG08_006059 [Glutinoglossum americanum]|uniref:NACHT domain-containing protein n=1 Tax=Glutinoglossum americanum TaxID=1670608 RepID=A0A9P8KXW1_9PEZI|nr:hypothetical protein FGG08_006059 [Glutinoglossum americanum]
MASDPGDSFSKSLAKFRANLSEEQRQQFSLSSIEDVELAIQQIQERIGPEKKLRNFTRIRKFLEAMKQVEELVKVFLNVHEVVAFIWVATTRIDTLEHLLGAYEEIGEVIHGLRQYDRLFRNYPDVRKVLERYFYDVLQFHQCVLEVFARPGWKRLFNYAWPTFKTRFQPIFDSLKRHRTLLSDEKLTAIIEEVQETRGVTDTKLDELSEQIRNGLDSVKEVIEKGIMELQYSLLERKSVVTAKLDPPDYEADQQAASAQRHCTSSGDWVLGEASFASWIHDDALPSGTLYLHGIPGSGKTTLVSRIIDYIRSRKTTLKKSIVFFYFKHRDDAKRSMGAMLRALMVQLLYQDDGLLEYLHQKCSSMSKSELTTLSVLQELTRECFMSQDKAWVVLDGLDECGDKQGADNKESWRVIEWFQNSVLPVSYSQGSRIRLLLAGQRDGYLDQQLSVHPGINLDATDAHVCDIQDYSKSRAAEIRERFSLDSSDEAKIIGKITGSSKGMFLYAKVVLDNLFSQGSPAELENELEEENFPEGLDPAYERVAIRIFDRPSRSKRESAAKILGWIVCSARPLRWREIQSRFCIDVDHECCNFKNRRVDSCKVLCGSLVEVEQCEQHADSASESFINFVHDTAGKYLIHSGRISLFEEHAKMAIFCSRYLTSYPFSDGLEANSIRDLALSGYYGFHDYAVVFWHYHVGRVLAGESNLTAGLRMDVLKSVIRLLGIYTTTPPTDPETQSPTSQPSPTEQDVRTLIETWRSNGGGAFAISERRTSAVRQVIESINPAQLDDKEKAGLLGLIGLPRFKCPKIQCLKFSAGFPNQQTRDSHVREHERPFKCPAEGCYARISGFLSQSALDVHVGRFHPDDKSPSTLFPHLKRKKQSNIFTACSQGSLEEVKAFHCQGANLDTALQENGGLTPLVLAVRQGHANVCAYLIKQGADVHRFKYGDISPLGETIKLGDYELFRFLCHTAGEDPKYFESSFTKHVALTLSFGRHEILEEILAWKPATDLSLTVLGILRSFCLCKTPTSDLSSVLDTTVPHKLFWRAFPSLYGPSGEILRPYSQPESQNPELEDWRSVLMSKHMGDTLLYDACRFGSYRAAAFLLDLLRPEDLIIGSKDRNTPLHTLATHSRTSEGRDYIARRLISATNGVAANTKGAEGRLPLHTACYYCCEEIFSLLVDYTTDLDEEDSNGERVLEMTVRMDLTDYVIRLLDTGRVNLMGRNRDGRTVFSVAAGGMGTSTAILELLYSAEESLASLRDDTPDRLTPLHHALQSSRVGKIKYLLSLPEANELVQGFLSSPANDNPKRALQLLEFALKNGFDAVAKSVLRSGIVGASQGTSETWETFKKLGVHDPEISQLLSSILL